MLLLIDNYDSFTYNLAHYLYELGVELQVLRNDQISVAEVERLNPAYIVISPGPGTPQEAGISLELIKNFTGKRPILGVCLGHQAIAEVFGAKLIHAPYILHGKTSQIEHDHSRLFANIPQTFKATRYHSLIIEADTLPEDLEATAWTHDNGCFELMALQHRQWPLYGVQFHPESILTEYGHRLLQNFLKVGLC